MSTIVQTHQIAGADRVLPLLGRAAKRVLAMAAMLMIFASIFVATILLRLYALASTNESVVQGLRRIGEALSGPL
jgi:hypothetical protein